MRGKIFVGMSKEILEVPSCLCLWVFEQNIAQEGWHYLRGAGLYHWRLSLLDLQLILPHPHNETAQDALVRLTRRVNQFPRGVRLLFVMVSKDCSLNIRPLQTCWAQLALSAE